MPGLLALLAHPDDEFFCGGLLAALQRKKIPLHLVYWTRGEGGGSPRFRRFWGSLPAAWHPRTREARGVAALLGAESLQFLGAIDPPPERGLRAPDESVGQALSKLAPVVAAHAPEIILTHGSSGDYGHPAHEKLHRIAREFAAGGPGPALVTFNAACAGHAPSRFVNAGDSADFVLDSSPYTNEKRNIVRAHHSQEGVLESIAGGGTLEALLEATRYEGYRCWTEKDAAVRQLRNWMEPPSHA